MGRCMGGCICSGHSISFLYIHLGYSFNDIALFQLSPLRRRIPLRGLCLARVESTLKKGSNAIVSLMPQNKTSLHPSLKVEMSESNVKELQLLIIFF